MCTPCALGTYAASPASATCSICPVNFTTAGVGSSACTVSTKTVPELHPDVFYVKVGFGVWFEGVSTVTGGGAENGLAATLGVAASEKDVFVHIVRNDVAKGFNVTSTEVFVSNITIPGAKVYEGRRRRGMLAVGGAGGDDSGGAMRHVSDGVNDGGARGGGARGLLAEQALVAGRKCDAEPTCVAAAAVLVVIQATQVQRYGVVVPYSTIVEQVAAADKRAQASLATLKANPQAFFPSTLQILGSGVGVALVGNVTRQEKAPDPPDPFKDLFDMLPMHPALLFGGIAAAVGFYLVSPRVLKLTVKWYKEWKVRRALRNVALGKSGIGDSQPEMRAMSRKALSRLAKYKVERGRSHLDRMWERRALPPKSVKPPVGATGGPRGQFGI